MNCNIKYNKSSSNCWMSTLIIFSILLFNSSCKKLVETGPQSTSVNADNVYTNDATAAAVLNGIYTTMSQEAFSDFTGPTAVPLYTGLSSDELTLYSGVYDPRFRAYYLNALQANNAGFEFWNSAYPIIYDANAAIEGLAASNALTSAVKQQLTGEAKMVRAFFYFYLVNLYGDVPLVLNTNYKANATLARTPKAMVYKQIISDLQDAVSTLSTTYVGADALTATTERTRPTKWAAAALLARVYLFYGNLSGDASNYVNAEQQATSVINNSAGYNLVTDLNGVFLANSNEAIWQLQPVIANINTQDAQVFILPETGPSSSTANPVYLSNYLLNSFENGDLRKVDWVSSIKVSDTTYFYPSKYKIKTVGAPLTEYLMMLRLGEQFLIRAEARVQQSNLSGAQSDLNAIRARAGLANTTANDRQSLLAAILRERRVELFTEWGHRWLDLKRTGTVGTVMSVVTPQKGGTWNISAQLYPLPLTDLRSDPALVQNPGY